MNSSLKKSKLVMQDTKAQASPHIQNRSNRKGKQISSAHCCRLLCTYQQIGKPRQGTNCTRIL
jgi:hypothetical protein